MVKYWDRLKSLMDEKDMGITEASKAIGVSFQAIAKVRDGGSFGLDKNLKAAKYFGVSSDWLATGRGEKYPGELSALISDEESQFLSAYRKQPSEEIRLKALDILTIGVNAPAKGKGHPPAKKGKKAA